MTLVVLGGPVALLLLFTAAYRGKIWNARSMTDDPSAERTLDRRYASGDLTREEYLTIRDDIKREQNA